MNRLIQTIALAACAGLLLGILLVLVGIGRHGVRIQLAGDVRVTGMAESINLSMSEPVRLVLEEPGRLVVTGAEGAAVPASVSLLTCRECGAAMLPVRWSPWTGRIEWACPACGATESRPGTTPADR